MIKYQNEVCKYQVDTAKGVKKMEEDIFLMGEQGFEVVSVVPADTHSRELWVFLKKAFPQNNDQNS